MINYINAELFAEHIKMLIDNDREMSDYVYTLASGIRGKNNNDYERLSRLSDILESEMQKRYEDINDSFLTDVLNKIYYNSDFYYQLSKGIWDDERTLQLINE